MESIKQELQLLSDQVADLKDMIDTHNHSGIQSNRLNLFDIFGLFENVTAVPTGSPSTPWDQIKIYSTGGAFRLYWYDATNAVWKYAAGL